MKRFILIICLALSSCGYANLDEVKRISPAVWEKQGFEAINYEGFQWGFWAGGSYGGAHVWYRLKKIPDNGITYSGFIQIWGGEPQIYGPIAIDAIRPNH